MGSRLERVDAEIALLTSVDYLACREGSTAKGLFHLSRLIGHLVLRGIEFRAYRVFARVGVLQALPWFLHVHIVSGSAVILLVGKKFCCDATDGRVFDCLGMAS